jgi:hypothetical protein
MTTTAAPDTSQTSQPPAPPRSGPSLVVPAVVTFVSLIASLIIGVAFAGSLYANPFADGDTIQKYFTENSTLIRFVALLQFVSAMGLAVFTATAWARLRQFTPTIIAPVAIATVGGIIASTFLALNSMVQWTLTQSAVNTDAPLVRALNYLFFGLGGPAHVAALGLLVFGLGTAGKGLRLLPGWFTIVGLVIVALCALSMLTTVTQAASPFIPLGRFTALIWLVALAFLTRRARRN